MPDKTDKNSRKKILDNLRKKAVEDFESGLPMSRDLFVKLFDFLNTELNDKNCDHTNRLARKFLTNTDIADSQAVLNWLAERGGYCDCEILANVEEQF